MSSYRNNETLLDKKKSYYHPSDGETFVVVKKKRKVRFRNWQTARLSNQPTVGVTNLTNARQQQNPVQNQLVQHPTPMRRTSWIDAFSATPRGRHIYFDTPPSDKGDTIRRLFQSPGGSPGPDGY